MQLKSFYSIFSRRLLSKLQNLINNESIIFNSPFVYRIIEAKTKATKSQSILNSNVINVPGVLKNY